MGSYSITDLDDLFSEAAETERRLPAAIRKQKMASWPEYLRDWKSYGWQDYTPRLSPATTKAVDRFELALDLGIKHMDKDARALVCLVAHSGAFNERGPRWTKIGRAMGLERRIVKRRYEQAIIRLYYKLLHS